MFSIYLKHFQNVVYYLTAHSDNMWTPHWSTLFHSFCFQNYW